jgi:hypothetical protein
MTQLKQDFKDLRYIFDSDAREAIALEKIVKTVKAEEKYGREVLGGEYTVPINETVKYWVISKILGYAYDLIPLPDIEHAGESLDSIFYCAGIALRNRGRIQNVFTLDTAEAYQDLDNVRR